MDTVLTDTGQAAALADALAPFDPDRLAALLDPDARVQAVSPAGIEDYASATAVIEAWGPWFAYYDRQEVLDRRVEDLAGVPSVTITYRLHADGQTYVMVFRNLVFALRDGRIAQLGGLCTGPLPEAGGPVG